jgi:hypothetical protein
LKYKSGIRIVHKDPDILKYCKSNQIRINDSPNRKSISSGGKKGVVFITDTTNSLSENSSGTSNAIYGYKGQNRDAVENGQFFFMLKAAIVLKTHMMYPY